MGIDQNLQGASAGLKECIPPESPALVGDRLELDM